MACCTFLLSLLRKPYWFTEYRAPCKNWPPIKAQREVDCNSTAGYSAVVICFMTPKSRRCQEVTASLKSSIGPSCFSKHLSLRNSRDKSLHQGAEICSIVFHQLKNRKQFLYVRLTCLAILKNTAVNNALT